MVRRLYEADLMTRLFTWLQTRWLRATETEAARNKTVLYLLGIVGWALIVQFYPFGWELPTYANY